MKSISFSIIAGVSAAILALAPVDASAQTRTRASGNVPGQTEINESVRNIIQRDRLTCEFQSARFIGRNSEDRTLYEVACANGPGFLLLDTEPSQTINCIANNASVAAARAADPNAQTGAECTIERNLDTVGAVGPYAQQADLTCTVDQARWMGQTSAGEQRYEIGCANAVGYWLDVNAQGEVSNPMSCLEVTNAGGSCQFTTAQESAAWIAALAAPSGRTCQATTGRYVGLNRDTGVRYYEVGCSEGPGFMVRTTANNTFEAVVECAAATGVAGGCTLSDTSAIQAAAASEYRTRLEQAGIACAFVSNGTPRQETAGDRRTVVEYECSDRPWGLVAFLPNGSGSPEEIDCLMGDARIGGCSITTKPAIVERLNALMTARGRECQVVDFRTLGSVDNEDANDPSSRGGDVVEVRCAQGEGLVVVVRTDRSEIGRVQTCATYAQRGGEACELEA